MKKLKIAGYCRISVDEDNKESIENQMMIINDYVEKHFNTSIVEYYEDRDKSGYTFEQRPGYQAMRKKLVEKEFDTLIFKDFSRFARRNSYGLLELEDLRDYGLRIISIGDNVDFPNNDDWLSIQFRFLMNELPVTEGSKKVLAIIDAKQKRGEWVCSVPYGYRVQKLKISVVEEEAEIVKKIFELYNQGLGIQKIALWLSTEKVPTPKSSRNELEYNKPWHKSTIAQILENDFYIGILRQKKSKRKKINGPSERFSKDKHLIFYNHHEAIIEEDVFMQAQKTKKKEVSTICHVKVI